MTAAQQRACSSSENEGIRRAVEPPGYRSDWHRLGRLDLGTIGVTLAVALCVTAPGLSPGICIGDSGGLQLASATLGITHPPGYVGYTSLGYLFTLVPGTDAARMVSIATLVCGMLTLLLCVLMQVRLGVSTGIACMMSLGLASHPRVWSNLLDPEVYMPSLMFVAAAAYLLTKYARRGVRRSLFAAAVLFGVALANRPPVILMLPFFLLAWWRAVMRWDGGWRRSAKSLLLVTLLGALPALYTLGFLWVRDRPGTPYNYIEQFNAEAHVLPSALAGPKAKVERIVWLVTGRQFRDKMGNTWRGVRNKLRWLANELIPDRWVAIRALPFRNIILWCTLAITVLAGGLAYRRCPVETLLLGGMAIGSIVFVCAYRMHGDAADLLPLLFVLAVLGGVGLSTVFPFQQRGWPRSLPMMLAGVACLVTVGDAPYRRKPGRGPDALPFLRKVDVPTLPKDAVICSAWGTSPPLWYAQTVMYDRSDIHVVNALESEWLRMTEGLANRPMFATTKPSQSSGFTGVPFRNLWRLARIAGAPDGTGEPTRARQRQ